jgi:hypothetical protein
VRARASGDRLTVRILARRRPDCRYEVVSVPVSRTAPRHRVARAAGPGARRLARSPGVAGHRMVTYRAVLVGGREIGRHRLSDDTYRAVDHVVVLAAPYTDGSPGTLLW